MKETFNEYLLRPENQEKARKYTYFFAIGFMSLLTVWWIYDFWGNEMLLVSILWVFSIYKLIKSYKKSIIE